MLISSMLGIVGGLVYENGKQVVEQIRYQRSELDAVKRELISLRRTNESLVKELIHVQAINSMYDSDARFIESKDEIAVEGYDGVLGVGGE